MEEKYIKEVTNSSDVLKELVSFNKNLAEDTSKGDLTGLLEVAMFVKDGQASFATVAGSYNGDYLELLYTSVATMIDAIDNDKVLTNLGIEPASIIADMMEVYIDKVSDGLIQVGDEKVDSLLATDKAFADFLNHHFRTLEKFGLVGSDSLDDALD